MRAKCCMTRRCSSVATSTRDLAAILASRLDAHQRATGPLPWLPPIPRQLAEIDFWGRYFARRHELIQRHSTAVRAAATSWTPETAPAWAVPTLSDASLTRDLAVWRAARDIPDTDLRATGPPANDRAGSHAQRRLDRRVTAARDLQTTLEPAVTRLAETIHPGITADPQWPILARQIAAARQAGIDRGELRRIATGRPLPIEAARRRPRVPPHRRYRRAPDIAARAAAQARRTMPVRAKAAACAAARPRPAWPNRHRASIPVPAGEQGCRRCYPLPHFLFGRLRATGVSRWLQRAAGPSSTK